MSKNWSDLPNELKVMCIEKMCFWTKIRVAQTSRTERALVDSMKPITWKTVTLNIIENSALAWSIRFVAESKKEELKVIRKADIGLEGAITEELSHLIYAFLYVFKKGNVRQFGVSERGLNSDPPHLVELLGKHAPYKFNKFLMKGSHSTVSSFFLKNNEQTLKKLHIVDDNNISCLSSGYPFSEEFPNMIKSLKLGASRQLQYFMCIPNEKLALMIIMNVLKYWIQNDAPIGTRMIIQRTLSSRRIAKYLQRVFRDLIANSPFLIRKYDENVPENTTKPKTILIRGEFFDVGVETTCVIIPTTLRPSEYENTKDWFWDARLKNFFVFH